MRSSGAALPRSGEGEFTEKAQTLLSGLDCSSSSSFFSSRFFFVLFFVLFFVIFVIFVASFESKPRIGRGVSTGVP